jgi:hypothetical protein
MRWTCHPGWEQLMTTLRFEFGKRVVTGCGDRVG